VFCEVYVKFLLVGHTHEDIDAMFGRWSCRFRETDYPTLPILMKSFMDVETKPVISHLIEEVLNFKAFVDGYLCSGNDALQGHTNAQQFKFYKDDNSWPLMQYKLWCTNSDWLPKENGGIRLWQETADGRPKVPSGSPVPLGPQRMRNFDEITKGLSGFVNLWDTMANEDISDEFRRWNEPLSYYWRAVRSTMALDISVSKTLCGGFWPSSRFGLDVEDEFMDDGTVHEEYTEDAPFVDLDVIVQPHHFMLVEMCMLDTLLQCILRMAICAHFGFLERLPTRAQILVTATKFRFSIGCLTLFNMYMQTHTLGGIQRKGMCGMRTRASYLCGPKLIVS
jgi:hypothetical protein